MAPRLVLLNRDDLGKSAKANLLREYKKMNEPKGMKKNTPMKKVLAFNSDWGWFDTETDLYDKLVEEYNKGITIKRAERDIVNKQKRSDRDKARRRTKVEDVGWVVDVPREQTFILTMKTRGTVYVQRGWYDYDTNIRYYKGQEVNWVETTSPITSTNPTEWIRVYLEQEVKYDDGYKTIVVLEYAVEYMDDPPTDIRPVTHQPMTRAFALKNDWLRHSHGIAQSAYDDSEGKCVYHQLDLFLNNPPTGRPTKFISRENTSQEALYNFFQRWAYNQPDWYADFNMNSGVSIAMIAELCRSIKRNMYAYDDDDKLIHSYSLVVGW